MTNRKKRYADLRPGDRQELLEALRTNCVHNVGSLLEFLEDSQNPNLDVESVIVGLAETALVENACNPVYDSDDDLYYPPSPAETSALHNLSVAGRASTEATIAATQAPRPQVGGSLVATVHRGRGTSRTNRRMDLAASAPLGRGICSTYGSVRTSSSDGASSADMSFAAYRGERPSSTACSQGREFAHGRRQSKFRREETPRSSTPRSEGPIYPIHTQLHPPAQHQLPPHVEIHPSWEWDANDPDARSLMELASGDAVLSPTSREPSDSPGTTSPPLISPPGSPGPPADSLLVAGAGRLGVRPPDERLPTPASARQPSIINNAAHTHTPHSLSSHSYSRGWNLTPRPTVPSTDPGASTNRTGPFPDRPRTPMRGRWYSPQRSNVFNAAPVPRERPPQSPPPAYSVYELPPPSSAPLSACGLSSVDVSTSSSAPSSADTPSRIDTRLSVPPAPRDDAPTPRTLSSMYPEVTEFHIPPPDEQNGPGKYFAVRIGYNVGIWRDWPDTSHQVLGCPNNSFKGYRTFAQARDAFLRALEAREVLVVPR
ncbi:hypothetical protein PUNSTDRAFT_137929 [Punctularia strigosozonata HHB-11173 SS5]|uniref:Ribonuclease H1 N-terminal domain-containing protein n=1 Tax=Punctularia strigosozonata (strain HHB-11173) TaxID=741275 RepID=R7S5K8_PUNST|nr:uncharacterized protein PUNSTDRAFT_137929 [Punctularia strigosozonata HHB-11173 SS5]EIN05247.1 hypothetical protein PUNSTDRAFT_137929 [Punctularia strigosozonata HHB-11173 SS5]